MTITCIKILNTQTRQSHVILPTILDTPTNRADMPDADTSTWVQPAAAAEAIGFLASDASRAITGALVPVNRGG